MSLPRMSTVFLSCCVVVLGVGGNSFNVFHLVEKGGYSFNVFRVVRPNKSSEMKVSEVSLYRNMR